MPPIASPNDGAVVRAYRQGLGDCFLLALPRGEQDSDAKPFTVLIDCGLFYQHPEQSERLRQVADDVAKATGGSIDVLVLTHEHFDHLAGFQWSAPLEIFRKRIRFGELWLAWTEDPDDALAQALRAEIAPAIAALRASMPHLDLLDFSTSTDSARRNALALFENEQIRYLSPGQSFLAFESTAAGAAAPRVFVLGPPKNRALLRVNQRDDALYAAAVGAEQAMLSALATRSGSQDSDPDLPFGKSVGLQLEQATSDPFFSERYGTGGQNGDAWRRIDDVLDGAASELALQYDNYVNNTSLVLAFELPNRRDVLLFVGDAQTGNWLSWADEENGAIGFALQDRQVSSIELIERTVFYKVGHHGSHNATLRSKGLERMQNKDLVAVVPTNEAWAWLSKSKGWRMPYLPLYQRLVEKTCGRVLQTDLGLPDNKVKLGPHPVAQKGLPYTDAQWQELQQTIARHAGSIARYRERVEETDVYFELRFVDPAFG